MPIIPQPYGGKTKQHLVEGAYNFCSLNGSEFALTPEELGQGLILLNDMMAEWREDGIDLGYDFPESGNSNGELDGASGVPDYAVTAVKTHLALRIAPGIAKQLTPEAKASLNQSYERLCSRFATIPTTKSPMSRGAGRKRHRLLPNTLGV